MKNKSDKSIEAQLTAASKSIENSKEWISFAKILTDEQRNEVKKLGVLAWLSQTKQDESE